MMAIGNDEIARAPALGKSIKCGLCGKRHQVKDSVDSTGVKGTLQFYKCGGKTYVAGMCGKDIRRK